MVSLVSDGNGGVMRDQFGNPVNGGYEQWPGQSMGWPQPAWMTAQRPSAPVDPYAGVRAQLAAQRAQFNPNYMRNYQPPPMTPLQGLAANPMVARYNAMHGYNSQVPSGGQFMGGPNPLVTAYNAIHGYNGNGVKYG